MKFVLRPQIITKFEEIPFEGNLDEVEKFVYNYIKQYPNRLVSIGKIIEGKENESPIIIGMGSKDKISIVE